MVDTIQTSFQSCFCSVEDWKYYAIAKNMRWWVLNNKSVPNLSIITKKCIEKSREHQEWLEVKKM